MTTTLLRVGCRGDIFALVTGEDDVLDPFHIHTVAIHFVP
jgi:hypothetical protein